MGSNSAEKNMDIRCTRNVLGFCQNMAIRHRGKNIFLDWHGMPKGVFCRVWNGTKDLCLTNWIPDTEWGKEQLSGKENGRDRGRRTETRELNTLGCLRMCHWHWHQISVHLYSCFHMGLCFHLWKKPKEQKQNKWEQIKANKKNWEGKKREILAWQVVLIPP